MKNYKMVITYDGTKWNGWQKQGKTEQTIQQKFEDILTRLAGAPVAVIGSGRTDAGVHALGQVANFHMDTTLSPADLQAYINQYLPQSIAVKQLVEADERFHARYLAREKTYLYVVATGQRPDVFLRSYCYHHPAPLQLGAMEAAAKRLEGTHDFLGFSALKNSKKSTVRTLSSITLTQKDDLLCIRFCGNGFLYHMVRILTGTLLAVGEGREIDIDRVFTEKDRALAGPTAPAQGLFLEEVVY